MENPVLSVPGMDLSLFLNTTTLSIVFIIFLIAYCTVSSVLVYHWSAYGMRHSGVLVAETLFICVSVVLLTVAGISVSYF